jgi:hypothetical protein
MGPSAGLDTFQKREISRPCQELNSNFSYSLLCRIGIVQTDCTILPQILKLNATEVFYCECTLSVFCKPFNNLRMHMQTQVGEHT